MEKKQKAKRKLYFRMLKKIMKIKYKEPRFIYLGEKFENGALLLSNHEGTDSPMSLEIYCDKPIRMWGTAEMNCGLIRLYKYQTRVYYHEKKHWNLFLARMFCLIASPLTNLFYKGLNLISTYRDARFMKTLRQSVEAIKNGDNIVIFPEDSTKGYLEQLEDFHHGFLSLCDYCAKKGIDVPIYVTYYRKKDLTYFVDNPILYSQLKAEEGTKEKMAKRLLDRCNALGRMEVNHVKGVYEIFMGDQQPESAVANAERSTN
jgi:hypothetical protein